MKENKYDDPDFFEAYSAFPRSVEGLRAAGEWHRLKEMLPPLEGKRVLDIGCGFGWHCIYAARAGAVSVVGVDISESMLREAVRRNSHPAVRYSLCAMEDLTAAEGSYDVVISSLAFHYTPLYEPLCGRIFRWLSPGGKFVFSVEHPVFTARGDQDWIYGAGGEKVCWPVDDYFSEDRRSARFLGSEVIKYHRTVESYLCGLLKAGFRIDAVAEPRPDPDLLDTVEGMRDELRRPMMLIVAATRP